MLFLPASSSARMLSRRDSTPATACDRNEPHLDVDDGLFGAAMGVAIQYIYWVVVGPPLLHLYSNSSGCFFNFLHRLFGSYSVGVVVVAACAIPLYSPSFRP